MENEKYRQLLEEQKNNLEKLKEQQKNNRRRLIKNAFSKESLSVVKGAAAIIAPFVLSLVILTGFTVKTDGDNPFKREKEKHYKQYSIEADYVEDEIIITEDYQKDIVESLELEAYPAWVDNGDGTFSRESTIYSLSKDCNYEELVEGILQNDMSLINKNVDVNTTETIVTNDISNYPKEGLVKAKIKYYNQEDYIEVFESAINVSNDKTAIIIFSIVISLICELIVIPLYAGPKIDNNYSRTRNYYKKLMIEIGLTNEKIKYAKEQISDLQRGLGAKS